jgi:hypothetical protein
VRNRPFLNDIKYKKGRILNGSGVDIRRDKMSDSKDAPQPVPSGPPLDNKRPEKRGLVERMYEARDSFAKERAEYAQFSRGYSLRLYAHFQIVYGMDRDFRGDRDELLRMTNQDYFNCNRQKPNENNLLRHLLYFFVDARTEEEREKWLRPASVLEHFRDQEVPVSEVAQRLKEGGGFSRIYKNFSGGRATVRDSYDDLDLLRQEPEPPDDERCETDPADAASGAAYVTYGKPVDAALLELVSSADGEGKVPEHGSAMTGGDHITSGAASARAINFNNDSISGGAETPKRISRTRIDLDNTVPVTIPPYDPNSLFPSFTVGSVIADSDEAGHAFQ